MNSDGGVEVDVDQLDTVHSRAKRDAALLLERELDNCDGRDRRRGQNGRAAIVRITLPQPRWRVHGV